MSDSGDKRDALRQAALDYHAGGERRLRRDVDPDQVASAQDNADWPESPEERIARVRAEAEEAQSTSAGQNRFSRSQKAAAKVMLSLMRRFGLFS